MRSPHTTTKSSPRLPQLGKACAQQRRPNTAKNKLKKKKKIARHCRYQFWTHLTSTHNNLHFIFLRKSKHLHTSTIYSKWQTRLTQGEEGGEFILQFRCPCSPLPSSKPSCVSEFKEKLNYFLFYANSKILSVIRSNNRCVILRFKILIRLLSSSFVLFFPLTQFLFIVISSCFVRIPLQVGHGDFKVISPVL